MLQAAPDARALTAPGETFLMDMDREPLGDIPLGKYQVVNTVTRIEPGRLFEWNVGMEPYGALGHVYGWELNPVSETETEVSNYCDWSNLKASMKDKVTFPIVPVHMLERSLDKLEAIATK